MVDISVIVPAYNAEKYLKACLESLVNQTKKDIEIIAINDGSKDNTLEILNEYKNKNPNLIKVISQENQGLSVTRNVGIKNSTGKYVMFVDSDDEIYSELLEKLWNKIQEYSFDVVAFDVDLIYPDKTVTIKSGITENIQSLNKNDRNAYFTDMYCMACNKIYKREIFDDDNMLFVPKTWFEDVLFLHKLIPNLNSVGYIDYSGYKYYQRENSITYTYSDKLIDINNVMENILEYYKQNKFYNEYEAELEYMYVRYMFATYIKRLAKSKNKRKFDEGVEFAKKKVNERFPNYKENIYLQKGKKAFYIKHFNKFFANIIYILEKNKMN